ncbi:MAG TPA: HAD family hydrolase [Streptosporangiaceae bacterium]|nr:HAD family hydrolase [Streptosporangiaceae bacterium]
MTELEALIARARYILLDFDGPVCDVYAGLPAPEVARTLREQLARDGIVLPEDHQPSDDPLDVFRGTTQLGRQTAAVVQKLLTALEVRAVATAQPTPGTADLIRQARATGRTVAIVSNNSGDAIRAYLAMHGLEHDVALVEGRDGTDAELMKPSPYLVRAAVSRLDTVGARCVFIGDSASDVLAGLVAGVPVIGYAPSPRKARELTDANVRALARSMNDISTAIRALPPASTAELART